MRKLPPTWGVLARCLRGSLARGRETRGSTNVPLLWLFNYCYLPRTRFRISSKHFYRNPVDSKGHDFHAIIFLTTWRTLLKKIWCQMGPRFDRDSCNSEARQPCACLAKPQGSPTDAAWKVASKLELLCDFVQSMFRPDTSKDQHHHHNNNKNAQSAKLCTTLK